MRRANPILVTVLNPIIGYQKAAEIAKQAYWQGRPVIDVALEHTDLSRSQLEILLDPESSRRLACNYRLALEAHHGALETHDRKS